MPRTKVVKKRRITQEKSVICNETVMEPNKKKDLNEKIAELKQVVHAAIETLETEMDKSVMDIKQFFKLVRLQAIDSGFGHRTLKEIRNLSPDDKNQGLSWKSLAMKDVNMFAKPKSTRPVRKRSNSCSSRSSKATYSSTRSASCEKPTRNIQNSANKLRTPINRGIPSMQVVTPKINPNQSVSVLRRPRQGEYALSMSGSPLMVSSVTYDDTVSVTIPLADGRVLSILPNEGIDSTNLNLDEGTRHQLMKLKSNLTKCLQK